MTWSEVKMAVLRGLGRYPTSYLIRWTPTLRNPFHFDLLEVMQCETDGEIVTRQMAQSPRAALHLGHRLKNPRRYSIFDFIKVQFRVIQ